MNDPANRVSTEAIAEVIESSTRAFLAEVYREAEAPAFGTWVEAEHASGLTLYGLVSHVEIGSFEPNRRAIAFGKTTEELQKELPHVMELLRTTFRAQVLAYRDARSAVRQAVRKTVRQTLPPHPAAIHAFVRPCSPGVLRELGRPYDFLRTLVKNPDPAVPVDDLVVAVLGGVYEAHGGRHGGADELVQAGRTLSRLIGDDHERLHSILRRIG